MRKTPQLFQQRVAMRFPNPLLYFLGDDRIVLPICSIDDFCESAMRKNAFFLGTKEQQVHPIEITLSEKIETIERMLIEELHRKEQYYPEHPVLVPDLTNLSLTYLLQKKYLKLKWLCSMQLH